MRSLSTAPCPLVPLPALTIADGHPLPTPAIGCAGNRLAICTRMFWRLGPYGFGPKPILVSFRRGDMRMAVFGDSDYKAVFDNTPSLVLVLDPGFKIVAQNKAHAAATLSAGKDLVGKNLFEAFPDNPNDSGAAGLSQLRASLLKVLKTREADSMPPFRFDIQGARGPFETRWWQVVNTPVLGEDGYVRWILNRAEDVTELVELRKLLAEAFPKVSGDRQ